MNGESIIAEARTWLGTRWQHAQSCKGVGTDCIGFVGGVALACGIPEAKQWASDPRWRGYGRTPDPKVLTAACDELLDPVPVSAVECGDVLVMIHERQPFPHHFALVSQVTPLHIIHAYAGARKVVEHIVDATWRARIVKAYRFR
jgi:NlpC/P60 family putative phage cell wall peptidase